MYASALHELVTNYDAYMNIYLYRLLKDYLHFVLPLNSSFISVPPGFWYSQHQQELQGLWKARKSGCHLIWVTSFPPDYILQWVHHVHNCRGSWVLSKRCYSPLTISLEGSCYSEGPQTESILETIQGSACICVTHVHACTNCFIK